MSAQTIADKYIKDFGARRFFREINPEDGVLMRLLGAEVHHEDWERAVDISHAVIVDGIVFQWSIPRRLPVLD
jgi:hypothetical protein